MKFCFCQPRLGHRAGGAAMRVEWEAVLASRPDVMVLACCGRSAKETAHEVWERLPGGAVYGDVHL